LRIEHELFPGVFLDYKKLDEINIKKGALDFFKREILGEKGGNDENIT
jgi:hypothetical protein